MTDSELAKAAGVSRQTIIAWKKDPTKLRRKPGPPTRNRRGKPSYDWEFVNPAPTQAPKWQLFERKCKAEGYAPIKVLELLLSKCRSEYMNAPGLGAFHDPDFFAAALYMVLAGAPSFLHTLFHGGGPPTAIETAIG